MKIQKIFDAITYIIVYRVIAIFGMIFMIGTIIYIIRLESDASAKALIVFIAVLGLFVICCLLYVAEQIRSGNKKNKITVSQKT